MEGEEREEGKRAGWRWENALRRWNFLGFVGGVLEGVVGGKLEGAAFNEWVEEAKGRTKVRAEERTRRGEGGEE